MVDDRMGCGTREQCSFNVSGKIIDYQRWLFPFHSNKSVANFCHGYAGKGVGMRGSGGFLRS